MPNIEQGWWISPDNKVYDVPMSHWGWVMDNKQMLVNDYGIDADELTKHDFGGYGNIECKILVDKGWIQLRLYKGQLTVIITDDINRLLWLRNYLDKQQLMFSEIVIDTTDNYERYDRDEFMTKYKTVIAGKYNTDVNEAWWLAPDNEMFEIPSDLSHWGWMQNNKKMLYEQYGLDAEHSEIWDFIAKGWIRIHLFNNQLVIDYRQGANLSRAVNLIYYFDIIKNVNGILNIDNVSVQRDDGYTNILKTKEFLRKYSRLNKIKSIKKQIIDEILK